MDTQTPAPANAIHHGACGQWWTGAERSHCGGCHQTFSSLTSFERHRKGLRCNDPATVGLVAREKPYGTLWGLPAPVGGYAGLHGRDESEAVTVTVHGARDLNPQAREALDALIDVATKQISEEP